MNVHSRRGRRLSAWFAAAGCALWLLAQAVPADAQASRTRPGGSSSSSSSGSRGGGGGSSASSGGSTSSPSSGGGPVSVTRTRPSSGSSGSQTVVDKRRPQPPGHPHGSHGGYGGYYYWGWPYQYGWWTGWSWWYPWGYGYPYPGYGYPPVVYSSQVSEALGALDTDVWPARTEIWINGQYVGFVDQFDGFPRYLWLEKGTYDVVFYLDGFKTLARQYTIYPGLVIDVEDRLERGEAIHPNDLAPAETPRRDARIREERERRAAEESEWRARVRADREAARDRPEGSEPAPRAAIGGDAWLYLRVTPPDAAVYLDGRFLGTARELSDRDTGISVSPGPHELSVVLPGYTDQRLEFEAEADGQVDLLVELEEA